MKKAVAQADQASAGPILCLNCDGILDKPKLFCCDLCTDEASLVRYIRRCRQDGRDKKPDVREAIQIQMAHILAGGYPERERELSKSVRLQVITRDDGRCRLCGKPGTEIDHISGSSGDLDNLQLLCRKCHIGKTKASMKPLTPENKRFDEYMDKIACLMDRSHAKEPRRVCDNPQRWPTEWKTILNERRRAFPGSAQSPGTS